MEVKGSVLLTIPMFIRKQYGRDAYESWLRALDPDIANAFGVTMSTSRWYPMREYLELPVQAMCDLLYNGDLRGAWDLGRFNADYSLKGAYAIFMKMGSVNFIIGRAAKILPMYYRPCAMTTEKVSGNSCDLLVTEFPEYSMLIEHRIAGWIEAALEIHGCRNIGVEAVESLATGAHITRYHVTWE